MVSEYIIFADETGIPSLKGNDPDQPAFTLVFIIIKRDDYPELVKNWLKLKLKFFTDPLLPLHNYHIRKPSGKYAILQQQIHKKKFLKSLNDLISATPFTIVAGSINKSALKPDYNRMQFYDIALGLCLERAQRFIQSQSDNSDTIPMIFESRGKKEDRELESEFKAMISGNLETQRTLGLFNHLERFNASYHCTQKVNAVVGIELADMVAYPIGRYLASGNEDSKSFQIVKEKIYHYRKTPTDGLRVFPFS